MGRENLDLDDHERQREDRFLIKEARKQRDAFDKCPRTADLAAHLPKYHVERLSAAFMEGIIRSVEKQENLLLAL